MAQRRLSVRKIRDVLRLHHAARLGRRAISRSLKLAPTTVGEYLRRAEAAGLGWPLPEDLDESALEQRLFPPAPTLPLAERPVPVWEAVHRELKRGKGMRALPSFPWCLPYLGGITHTRISGSRQGQGEAAGRDERG
jgi:hypothetical protein